MMGRVQGYRLYRHIRETRPQRALEIGTAWGARTAFIAAALHENGSGVVTTVDHRDAAYTDPVSATAVIERLGLAEYVEFVRIPDSSYTWWLRDRIAERTLDGTVEPLFDFAFLDGSHSWTMDGFSVYLIEKLLKKNGWLLLDDLDWTCADNYAERPPSAPASHPFSDAEWEAPHIRSVLELIVKQHPAFVEIIEQAGVWAWARKGAPGDVRSVNVKPAWPVGLRIKTAFLERLNRQATVT
jgi:predicted O-methyltransferase YrrM